MISFKTSKEWCRNHMMLIAMVGYTVATSFFLIALFAFFIGLFHLFGEAQQEHCIKSWTDSGFKSRYIDGQCQVRLEDGRWVPESAVQFKVER